MKRPAVLIALAVLLAGAVAVYAYDSSREDRIAEGVRAAGVDLDAITTQLEREGVESFCRSYEELLDCIERKLDWVQVEA